MSRPEIRRFRRESILFGVLLLLWVAAFQATTHSHRWRALFASGEELLDVAGDPPAPTAPRAPARPRPHPSGRSVDRLPRIQTRSGTDYLLTLRAADGPAFLVGAFPAAGSSPVRRVRIPARDRGRTCAILFAAEDLGETMEVRLLFQEAARSETADLSLRALSAAHRRVIPALLAVLALLCGSLFGFRHRQRLRAYLSGGAGPPTATDLLFGWILLLALFVPFRQAPNIQLIDSRYLTAVSHSLLAAGSLAIDPGFGPLVQNPESYHFDHVGERTFHFFANAPAVLNAPVVWAFERAGFPSVASDGRYFRHQEIRILRFAAALTAALLCVALFALARIWLPPAEAIVLTLVFAFGSQILSTISRPYWSHAWASLLLAVALYPILAPTTRDRTGSYVLSASLISWAFFCRPSMALSAIAVALFVAATRRRFTWHLLATGGVWLTLFVAFTRWERGQWLPAYFYESHLSSGRVLGNAARSGYLEATLGTLISPGRGLLIYVPITLAIVVVGWRYRAALPSKALAIAAAAVCLAHWQLISGFRNWWGGFCFGPRLFSDIVVWLFVLGALGTAAARTEAIAPRRLAARLLSRSLLLLLIAASIFINVRGAYSREVMRWSASVAEHRPRSGEQRARATTARIWDWGHPQFLFGLWPADEP